MNKNNQRYTITSALPYANGPLHIGHMAGAILPADIYARFQRSMGKDVLYVCGSDEHGAAITVKAQQENLSPKEITDHYHTQFKDSFERFGISVDQYHRTSAPNHHDISQQFFRKLLEKKALVTQSSEQYYDEAANQFLADRYIMGTCPNCRFEEAYGDQCEQCGSTLSPTELIKPKSRLSGAEPILKETTHWYLRLDEMEQWLKEWISKGLDGDNKQHNPEDWKNHVIGQCMSWLDGGLQERAMTRDLDWGVDVPQDIAGAQGKKLYVWLDAPIGYISASEQWAQEKNKDWKPYWLDKDTRLINFIGKDNIVFHCIIFPAILKEMGDYILPYNVPANQFLNLEGKKISTSRNWAIWMHEYMDENPDKIEELRYYLIKIMPEQKDAEFTWSGFQEAVNNDLVNNLANFTNRVMVLCHKYYDGKIPEFDMESSIKDSEGEFSFWDAEMISLHDLAQEVHEYIRKFQFRDALKGILKISTKGNQLLQVNEPWKLQKVDPSTVAALLNLCCQYVAIISTSIRYFLPKTASNLASQLNWNMEFDPGFQLQILNTICEGKAILPSEHVMSDPKHLFSRIEDQWIEKQLGKLEARPEEDHTENETFPPLVATTDYGDFTKIDLRIGTITHAERIKKADKLLKLAVDLGFEHRTIVSGIAQHYKPEEIIGKQVVVLANLAPKKLRGVESNGMILMADDAEGRLSFISPEKAWPNGFTVR